MLKTASEGTGRVGECGLTTKDAKGHEEDDGTQKRRRAPRGLAATKEEMDPQISQMDAD